MTEDIEIKTRQLAELAERRDKVKEMGGRERVEVQKKRGKLTARERIDQLMDNASFREIGVFAKSRGAAGRCRPMPFDIVPKGIGATQVELSEY
jgi:acetyl-CoA carboxylase carboxyltransferase component